MFIGPCIILIAAKWEATEKETTRTNCIDQLCFSVHPGYYSSSTAPNLQHTANQERNDQCCNSTTQSQAPDDGYINRLTPNDSYMGRTALLTSKRCILYIYSTNIGAEYFEHVLYSPFFSLQNAVCFVVLTCFGSCLIHILYTGCAKI